MPEFGPENRRKTAGMAPNREQEINALLAGYATGRLPGPLNVLVEAHLELAPANRRYVEDLELMSGRAIEETAPVDLTDRDSRLAAIFALPDVAARPMRAIARPAGAPRLPDAIRRFVGHDVDTMPWKSVLPGFKEYKVGEFDGLKTSLFWIRSGQKIPSHTHEGSEVTLVCEGGFSDLLGSYERGDISVSDSSVDHQPIADDDGDCIGFAVTDAPLRLTGIIGRLFNPFIRV
jgi:putative transcriptional regulator